MISIKIVRFVTEEFKMNDILGEREGQHPFQWEDESRDSQDDRSVIFIIIVPSFKGLKI